jgi:hypothetical protein
MSTKKTTTRKAIDPRATAPQASTKPEASTKAEAETASTSAAADDPAPVKRRLTAEEKRKAAGAELVSVSVPRPFKFTCDDYSTIEYPSGIYDMPRAHAEDSFARGMGVTLNDE